MRICEPIDTPVKSDGKSSKASPAKPKGVSKAAPVKNQTKSVSMKAPKTKPATTKPAKTSTSTASAKPTTYTTKQVEATGRKEDFEHKGFGRWAFKEGVAPYEVTAASANAVPKKKATATKTASPAEVTKPTKQTTTTKKTSPAAKAKKRTIAPPQSVFSLKTGGKEISAKQRRSLLKLYQQAIDLHTALANEGEVAATICGLVEDAICDRFEGFPSILEELPPPPFRREVRRFASPLHRDFDFMGLNCLGLE